MKKLIFTHLFLNLYILAIIQPALPIIEYLVNYNYIVNELCENKNKPILTCNGKCYLETQVKEQQNLDHNPETPMPPKRDFEKLLTLNSQQFVYSFVIQEKTNQKPIFYNQLKDRIIDTSLFRPPAV